MENVNNLNNQKVKITHDINEDLQEIINAKSISRLILEYGIPYNFLYNFKNSRVKSISVDHYRKLFGKDPSRKAQDRVSGRFFRKMVNLWLYLNEDVTQIDIYKELYPERNHKRIDYRVFTGDIKTVPIRIKNIMEQKFIINGFSKTDIKNLIAEMGFINIEKRISYKEIEHTLLFLKKHLGVNPSRLLNQDYHRFQSGELKTITLVVFNHIKKIEKETKKAIGMNSRYKLEKIKEGVYGYRKNFVLYSEVEEELKFLKKYAGKSFRSYLGRSRSGYSRSVLKRIASWRAQEIRDDFNELVKTKVDIPLFLLPSNYAKKKIKAFITYLKYYSIVKSIEDNKSAHEKALLTPGYEENKYFDNEKHELISMDNANLLLGMSKKAFDQMVAVNRNIFKRIGVYNKKWYVSNRYLKELKRKKGFNFIKEKYEYLAREHELSHLLQKQKRKSILTPNTHGNMPH